MFEKLKATYSSFKVNFSIKCGDISDFCVVNDLCFFVRYLVHCLQADLNNYMPAFLDDPEEHNPQRPKIGNFKEKLK